MKEEPLSSILKDESFHQALGREGSGERGRGEQGQRQGATNESYVWGNCKEFRRARTQVQDGL